MDWASKIEGISTSITNENFVHQKLINYLVILVLFGVPSEDLVIKITTLVWHHRGTAEIHPSSCYSTILAYFFKYFPIQRKEVCNILYNGVVLYKNDLGLTHRTPLALSSVT